MKKNEEDYGDYDDSLAREINDRYEMSIEDICVSCNGSGEGQHDGTRCWNCNGSGVVYYHDENYD